MDFFTDLLAVLKQLAYAHVLDIEGSFQCVLTTLHLVSGQGAQRVQWMAVLAAGVR